MRIIRPFPTEGSPLTPVPMRCRGIVLIECLVYFGLFFVILGLAYGAYERTQTVSKQLRKNSEEIVASVRAGERWREDVRLSTAQPRVTGDEIHMQQNGVEVVYRLHEAKVFREQSGNAVSILSDIKSSRMHVDQDGAVTSCRWELELKSQAESPHVRPLFTFQAVSGGGSQK